MIGKRLENEKMAYGASDGFRGNQYRMVNDQIEPLAKPKAQNEPVVLKEKKLDTAQRLADEYGVGRESVKRAEKYAKGVDIADEIEPGAKEAILSGADCILKIK